MDRLEELKQRIDKFNKDRDWDQFHTPTNLAKSISIEANELLECYQWNDNANLDDVKEELADVMNYCLQMSMVLGLDPIDIMNYKMDKTEKKYTVEKAKGVIENSDGTADEKYMAYANSIEAAKEGFAESIQS